jgi:hypothetical protein
MPDPLDELRKQNHEVPYDEGGRIARSRGPGQPWQLTWSDGTDAGTCSFDNILSHWSDRSGLHNKLLADFVRSQYPPGCHEQTSLAELLARLRSSTS